MRNLKCWPGAVAQVTRVQMGTDEEQMLGRVVRVVKLGDVSAAGICWVIEKPIDITFTMQSQSSCDGTIFRVGAKAVVNQCPDAYLTPFPDLDEPDEQLEDSELDIEHSFTEPAPQEHEHA